MDALKAVDGLDILILVDNVTDGLSSLSAFVETEDRSVTRRRKA